MDNNQTFLNACRNGQKNIVKILADRGGIDLDRRDAEGNTPLYYACRQGYRDVAALLLERVPTRRWPTTAARRPCMPRRGAATARSSTASWRGAPIPTLPTTRGARP